MNDTSLLTVMIGQTNSLLYWLF